MSNNLSLMYTSYYTLRKLAYFSLTMALAINKRVNWTRP